MKNKVEIRAFAIEQVVKMWCMDKVSVDELIGYAKKVEEYIIGGADMEEYEDPNKMLKDMVDMAKKYPLETVGMMGASCISS